MEKIMKALKYLGIALILLLLPITGFAEEPKRIPNGFVTAKDYIHLFTKLQKEVYLAGIIDGVSLSPIFRTEKNMMAWIAFCIARLNTIQIQEVVENYLLKHKPDKNEPMNAVLYKAFLGRCRQL